MPQLRQAKVDWMGWRMTRWLAAMGLTLMLMAPQARASAVVAVDPGFAPVATALLQLFAEQTGHDLVLSVAPAPALEQTVADVLLAPDADLPARLAEAGRAAPDTLVTYAMGPEGTEDATRPRDAVLLAEGAANPVARSFMAFLMTPEAWDVIVSHGFGAH